MPTYSVPKTVTSYIVNSGNLFLILNSDFSNDTYLNGFELNVALAGSITIQVINSF